MRHATFRALFPPPFAFGVPFRVVADPGGWLADLAVDLRVDRRARDHPRAILVAAPAGRGAPRLRRPGARRLATARAVAGTAGAHRTPGPAGSHPRHRARQPAQS